MGLHFGASSSLLPLLESTNRWKIIQHHNELILDMDRKYFAIVYTMPNTLDDTHEGKIEPFSDTMKDVVIRASYLIVVGDCENSPTDIGIHEDRGSYDFSIVEEVCPEEMGASGVIM